MAVGLDQFFVAANFHQRPVPYHGHPVGPFGRRQPVGDDDDGAPGGQGRQCLFSLAFGPGVDAGGGLVHDQHGRVGEGGPGQADQLALAGRQV